MESIALVAGRDYPNTYRGFVEMFPDNASCAAYLLKRWILGTHQGSVVPEHLQSYLEEFTFRFNRRTSGSRGLVFRRLLEQAVATGPITERDVTHGYEWG